MNDELSVVRTENPELPSKAQDRKAAVLRAIVGSAPVVGTFLTEIVNEIIPNQRVERIALFAEILDQRLSSIEVDVLKAKIKSEQFTDLLEDGLNQAVRSTTDERRTFIASLLTRSITSEECSHIEEKKLLSLLGALNDPEILILRYNSIMFTDAGLAFKKKHHELIYPGGYRDREIRRTKIAFLESYQKRLVEFGLLKPDYKLRMSDDGRIGPEFESDGSMKISNHRVTELGEMFLRYLFDDPDRDTSQKKGIGNNPLKD